MTSPFDPGWVAPPSVVASSDQMGALVRDLNLEQLLGFLFTVTDGNCQVATSLVDGSIEMHEAGAMTLGLTNSWASVVVFEVGKRLGLRVKKDVTLVHALFAEAEKLAGE